MPSCLALYLLCQFNRMRGPGLGWIDIIDPLIALSGNSSIIFSCFVLALLSVSCVLLSRLALLASLQFEYRENVCA